MIHATNRTTATLVFHGMARHAMPCHAMSCHGVASHRIVSYHVVSHRIVAQAHPRILAAKVRSAQALGLGWNTKAIGLAFLTSIEYDIQNRHGIDDGKDIGSVGGLGLCISLCELASELHKSGHRTTGHGLFLRAIPMFQHHALLSYTLTCALPNFL